MSFDNCGVHGCIHAAIYCDTHAREINQGEINRVFQVLESYGVPRERARNIGNGVMVLATRYERETAALTAEVARLRGILANPPQHRFWRPGETDCPRDIKAPNGELHTLRCKVCGQDNPANDICLARLQGGEGAARDGSV